MIALSDPEITRIPVVECHEPLTDLRASSALLVDDRLADPDGAYAMLRSTVADRLVTAQTLLPRGLRLLVVEGFRPLALQRRYFDAHLARLLERHPDWPPERLYRQASLYISPPEVAPHVAGGAVDLTLSTPDGRELDLGTAVNDTDTTACHTQSPDITAQAGEYRAILSAAMTRLGLVNYPTEWWHWSYGDRYWAHVRGTGAARYGPAEFSVSDR